MNEEQWFGLLGLIVGLYLFVCATWKRDFFLYDWTEPVNASETLLEIN